MQQLLRIHWRYEIEFVSFDEDDGSIGQMRTTGRWSDSRDVTYDVNASLTRKKTSRILKLTYESSNQTDQVVRSAEAGVVRYGKSVITWIKGGTEGQAKWEDNEQGSSYDGIAQVAVLGGHNHDNYKRYIKSINVKQRPKQSAFRDALFQLDKQCVLTGETCRQALQAAHLVPVQKNGQEQIENGILLRADLHALFDAGLLWFEVSESHATVKCLPSALTESYLKVVNEKRLPSDTFRRVKAALHLRAAIPGGRGREPQPKTGGR
jgi:hypothetical protein